MEKELKDFEKFCQMNKRLTIKQLTQEIRKRKMKVSKKIRVEFVVCCQEFLRKHILTIFSKASIDSILILTKEFKFIKNLNK